ncbi:hypothetical protein B0H10DRAFT_1988834 [Mycena sp. CBHHK59/15]|nr:hypothetical protein B0H10DRAFT_1988834 [Mycena sp. CBHHK59/15]
MTPTIVITGASKGIGLAVTRILLKKFNVNVVALSRTHTPELLALASDSLLLVDCDVANESALKDAIALAVKTFSGIDGLILNAAVLAPLCRIGDDTPLQQWKIHFDVNFFSLVTALTAALPSLRKSKLGGRVVFVSSGAAVKGTPGWAPYAASKAAMNSLCRTLGEEEPDVTSVALRPGMVQTDMQAMLRDSGVQHLAEKDYQMFISAHNDGKLLKAEDPAHVIASLALHAVKSLSGQYVSWDSEECAEHRAV